MVKYLEDLLFFKTKDTQSAILYAQWNYDKKIAPDALNSIFNLFPHYSLHDESHSITIINNIVRVIGKENIAKLSAIDIWLILEAAYWHDIGMAVLGRKLDETINEKEFIQFFRELIQDTKHSLNEFAIKFEIVNNQIRLKDTLFSLEQNDGMKFILAEFFRRKHSDRSKEIINDPLYELKLASPRGVIPDRINKILSNICSCHTKDFADVMNLSFCEVGIDTENAHPRFVACLLRIGDLLDLDNNRFSEVMLRTLTKLPKDTLIHKEKHLSIESFRVDNDMIEITASCKDYDVASAAQHWFDFLDTEISNQMKNWNKIVPFKDLGFLPTIGDLRVNLLTYEAIDGKNKPQFSVDTEKALDLLIGSGLYDGVHKCMREILQNAVDATLIRIWLEYGCQKGKNFLSPKNNDFTGIVDQYPITVNIMEKEVEGELKNWTIEIIDTGTGISTTDLKFLMNTGSSSKNRERVNIIEDMPIWMRPSGTFGIGFQSIFMLTDLVTIETKSFSDEEFQIIKLYSPISKNNGGILVQKKKTTHAQKPGTKLLFNHKTKAIPDHYSYTGEYARDIVNNFDPFFSKSMDIEIGNIVTEIIKFNEKSYFPIKLNLNNQPLILNSAQKQFAFFEPENVMEFNIKCPSKNEGNHFITYYKNQEITNRFNFQFLSFEINIHNEKASNVLTLNRKEMKLEYEDQFDKEFKKSVLKIITEDFEKIFSTEEEKWFGSMFISANFEDKDLQNKFRHWENFEIPMSNGQQMKMKTILDSITKLTIVYNDTVFLDTYDLNHTELKVTFSNRGSRYDFSKFFLLKAKELFKSFSIIHATELNNVDVIFTMEEQGSPIPDEKIFDFIKKLKYSSVARGITYCLKEHFILRIKDDAYPPYVRHNLFFRDIYLPFPRMLSPFIRKVTDSGQAILVEKINETLIDWVYEYKFDKETTKEQIIEGYKAFCQKINLEEINKDSPPSV
jgi:hypothetical protein